MRWREANARELNRLRIITNNLERILDNVEANPEPQREETRRPPHYVHQHPVVRDIDRVEILIGDTVTFLSRGLYNTTSWIVYRFLASGNRVTARHSCGRPITCAPHNLRIVLNQAQWATKTKNQDLESLLQLQSSQAQDRGKLNEEGNRDQPCQTPSHIVERMTPLELSSHLEQSILTRRYLSKSLWKRYQTM